MPDKRWKNVGVVKVFVPLYYDCDFDCDTSSAMGMKDLLNTMSPLWDMARLGENRVWSESGFVYLALKVFWEQRWAGNTKVFMYQRRSIWLCSLLLYSSFLQCLGRVCECVTWYRRRFFFANVVVEWAPYGDGEFDDGKGGNDRDVAVLAQSVRWLLGDSWGYAAAFYSRAARSRSFSG